MIHAQLLGPDQLERVKKLGIIPSFFLAHVYHLSLIHICGAVKLESVEGTGNFLMDTMTMMFIPVSYTHLDVYKRQ